MNPETYEQNDLSSEKKLLLPIILNDYQKEDPEAECVPIRGINSRLEQD